MNKIHFSLHKSKENLFKSEYYYEGITKDFLSYINKCHICNITKQITKINIPMKIIIENGPHYRYQMDIWYLPKDIGLSSGYNYVLDILDHFSKWIFSYGLKEKTGFEVLICLRKFILSFGICKKLQTDNGLEFKNVLINNYCIENNIERIFSPPYHPQSNGSIEAAHKTIQKFVYEEFYINKDKDFNLDEALINANEYHNNSIHYTTLYKPIDIKDLEDNTKIEEIKSNIIKNVGSKIKINNDKLLVEGDKVIINNNIYVNKKKKEILKLNNKKKGRFIIPAIFIKYGKGNNLLIKSSKDYRNIIIKDIEYNIKYELVRLISDYGYDYFVEYEEYD